MCRGAIFRQANFFKRIEHQTPTYTYGRMTLRRLAVIYVVNLVLPLVRGPIADARGRSRVPRATPPKV